MVHDTEIMVVIVMVTIAVCDGDNCGDIQPIIKTTENEMTNKTQTCVKKKLPHAQHKRSIERQAKIDKFSER